MCICLIFLSTLKHWKNAVVYFYKLNPYQPGVAFHIESSLFWFWFLWNHLFYSASRLISIWNPTLGCNGLKSFKTLQMWMCNLFYYFTIFCPTTCKINRKGGWINQQGWETGQIKITKIYLAGRDVLLFLYRVESSKTDASTKTWQLSKYAYFSKIF